MFSFIRSIRSNRNLKQFLTMLETLGDRNLTATDIVSLKEPLRSVLSGAIRAGRIRLEDFAKDLSISPDGASRLANVLVKKGLFHHIHGTTYDVRASGKTYGHERPQTIQLWAKFNDDKDDDAS